MITTVSSSASKEPLTLPMVKQHLRIVEGYTEHDDTLNLLIKTARQRAENITQRKLITQTIKLYLQDWPEYDLNPYPAMTQERYSQEDCIALPYGQLQSVTSVKYTDSDETQSTWSSTSYDVDTDSDPGRVVLAYGESWPSVTLYSKNPIEIEYVCGYGDDPDDVEPEIRQAMLMIISSLYENREDWTVGTIVSPNPLTAKLLLQSHRLYAF